MKQHYLNRHHSSIHTYIHILSPIWNLKSSWKSWNFSKSWIFFDNTEISLKRLRHEFTKGQKVKVEMQKFYGQTNAQTDGQTKLLSFAKAKLKSWKFSKSWIFLNIVFFRWKISLKRLRHFCSYVKGRNKMRKKIESRSVSE